MITRVLGASHGVKGILNDELFDISKEDEHELELLKSTPSSALGSCRYKLKDPERMILITGAFLRFLKSMMSGIFSITAAMTRGYLQ